MGGACDAHGVGEPSHGQPFGSEKSIWILFSLNRGEAVSNSLFLRTPSGDPEDWVTGEGGGRPEEREREGIRDASELPEVEPKGRTEGLRTES